MPIYLKWLLSIFVVIIACLFTAMLVIRSLDPTNREPLVNKAKTVGQAQAPAKPKVSLQKIDRVPLDVTSGRMVYLGKLEEESEDAPAAISENVKRIQVAGLTDPPVILGALANLSHYEVSVEYALDKFDNLAWSRVGPVFMQNEDQERYFLSIERANGDREHMVQAIVVLKGEKAVKALNVRFPSIRLPAPWDHRIRLIIEREWMSVASFNKGEKFHTAGSRYSLWISDKVDE